MSQESNLFSVRRPRETLGAVSHNISAIPMPASALKRSTSQNTFHQAPSTTTHTRTTSASRISLAPGRPSQPVFHRSSSATGLADLGCSTVQRPCSANLLQSTGGRKSYAPVTGTPAHAQSHHLQLQDSTQRRSSVYSARPSSGFGPAGHQSFFATAPPQNGVPTDPRRLRDASTRAQMGQELMDFLTQRNFEMEMKHSLTHKTMTSPTQKDFNLMFQFLYHCIDPSYRFQKNIDAEVPPLLKQLRYPFEKNISKSQLAAVGGNNWATFLALLHWMMNLAKMMEQYSTGVYDDACISAGYDVRADRITFSFLSNAYKAWLAIEDDDEENGDGENDAEAQRRLQPHIDAMAAQFEQANQANLEQAKVLEAESQRLQAQIDELSKSAPRLAKLDETIKVLEEDRAKFETYNASMDAKVDKYLNRAQLLQEELEKTERELQEAEADRDDLQARVDARGISVQQIDRMSADRERLLRSAEQSARRLEESKEAMSRGEAEAAAKLDELEGAVQGYNALAYRIGIIPASAPNAHEGVQELRLRLSAGPEEFVPSSSQLGHQQQQQQDDAGNDRLLAQSGVGYTPSLLLPNPSLPTTKQALQELRRAVSERRSALLEDDLAKQDLLAATREALDDKHAELEALGHRLRAAQEEWERSKEVGGARDMHGEAQIERMEREIGRIRTGVEESVLEVEARELEVNFEYEQLTLRCAALREELHTELERSLNEIIKFKIHIQGSLEGYEEFVAKEVERECEEQEVHAARREVDDVQGLEEE